MQKRMKARPNQSRGDTFRERLLAVLLNRWFIAAWVAIFLLLASLELANIVDEGIWEYSAWLWAVHGAPPYVGSFENKPPGIFLLYRLCYAVFGLNFWPVRILSAAATIGTLLLLYELGRGYQGRIAGAMAALIFGLAMGHHVTDGHMLALTEPFMILGTASAFYLLSTVYWHRPAAGPWRAMLGIGAGSGAALSFKQIALADVIGLAPMYWVAAGQHASLRRVVRDVLLMLLAGSAVMVLTLLPLLADGVTLRDYWMRTWRILFCQATGALSTAQRLKLIGSTWANPAIAAYYPLLFLYLCQKNRLRRAGIPFGSLLFWLALTFVAANASNVFKHQLKQMMLPFSLMAGIGIGSFVEFAGFTPRWVLWLYLSVVAALAPLNGVLIGIARHVVPGVMSSPGVLEEQTDRRLAEYIRAHTTPSQCVYIWANISHPILLYSQRRSSCRYFNAILRFASDFETATAADLAGAAAGVGPHQRRRR